jgi:hypothetical protein
MVFFARYQRLVKMFERTFLKEKVRKREQQERYHRKEEREILRKKQSGWNPFRRHQKRQKQNLMIGTSPAQEII